MNPLVFSELRPGQRILYHGAQGKEYGTVARQDRKEHKVWIRWDNDGEELYFYYDSDSKVYGATKLDKVLR
jgi:hypothetical protein